MKDVLQKITQNKSLEVKWLHTLSLLESIGARKISKSFGRSHPDVEALKHLADEARHAMAFKKLSCELGASSNPGYLCAAEAISYFQILDKSIDEWIQQHSFNDPHKGSYWLVTAVIEKRAMKIYPLYRSFTQVSQVREELQKIILEESDHKPHIEEQAYQYLQKQGHSFEIIQNLEEKLFTDFQDHLTRHLAL